MKSYFEPLAIVKKTGGRMAGDLHSSKGNQFKMHLGDKWYKADFFGYEAAAERMCSSILKASNVTEFCRL